MVNVLNIIKKTLLGMFLIPIIPLHTVSAETQFISPQLAFKPVVSGDNVSIKIAPNYYLYQKRIQVFNSATGKPIKFSYLSTPIVKKFKDVPEPQKLFVGSANLKIHAPVNTKFTLSYQGCSNQGLCYPPQRQQLTVK